MNQFSKGKSMSVAMLCSMLCMSSIALAQPMSGAYTINASQATGGNNFSSFNDAVTALNINGVNAPVTFDVSADLFHEQVIIPEISGASPVNTITFNGNESIILYNSTDANQRAVVKLDGADYITLRGLSIKSTAGTSADYGYGIQLINGAQYNHIVHCAVSVSEVFSPALVANFAGIVLNSTAQAVVTPGDARSNYNIIDSNIVSGGYHGIALVADGDNFQIRGNTVRSNTIIDFYNAGIYLNGNDGTIIEGNDISRPNRSTSALFYGIQLYNISKNVAITRNRIHDPFGGTSAYVTSGANGIYLVDAQAGPGEENVIANNIIYNLKCNSIIRAIWLGNTTSTSVGSSFNKIIHNTISLDDIAFTGVTGSTGIESSVSAQNVTIQNNIISIKRVGASFSTRIGINCPSINNLVNHNDIFIAAGSTNYFTKWGAVNCATVADWQNNSGDNTSISEDPQFNNMLSGDLLPANNALQAGAAVSITGITSDIAGLGRNGIPTLGAFEIGGIVLPVTMSDLKGNMDYSGNAVLHWQTFSEINNKGFRVQTSNDGKSWEQAGFVISRAVNGNSNSPLSYTYRDTKKLQGKVFYRLEQSDIDHKVTYSNIIVLQSVPGKGQYLVYPNPARNFIRVTGMAVAQGHSTLTISDLTGRAVLLNQVSDCNARIDISSLPAGPYTARIEAGPEVQSVRFVKLK